MLAVHFLGQGKISLGDVPMPEPREREVVVRMRSASICGTDRENLEGAGQAAIPGHESAGEVVAIDHPTYVRVGDRVAINCHVTCRSCEHCLRGDLFLCKELRAIGVDRDGGLAEFALVPEACCMPLPNDISFEAASLMVDMVGTPFRAVKRASLPPRAQVAIWGAGPVGLGALLTNCWFGAKSAVIDVSDYRLAMAKSLGAELVLNPKREDVKSALLAWTSERGVAAAFECAGREDSAQQALACLEPRGKLALIGVGHHLSLDPWHMIQNELAVYGSRNFNLGEFDEMLAMVRHGLPLNKIVTHRFRISAAEQAFAVFRGGQCGKILFTA